MALRLLGVRRPRWGLIALAGWLCIHCGTADPIEQARAYGAAGRLDEALEVLRPLIEERSRDPEVLYLYGTTLRRKGRPGLALWSLRHSSLSPGWEVRSGLQLSAAALEARNFGTSIEAATRVLEHEPENLQALVLRAEARLEDRSDYEASLADYERVLELDPDNLRVRMSRVANLLVLERIDEAAEGLAEIEQLAAEKRLPEAELARFCVGRATFERENDNTELADAAFTDCLERYPQDSFVVNTAVEHYDETDRFEQGNEVLDTFLEDIPHAFTERSLLAKRLSSLGKIDQAEALLQEGTEVEGRFAAAASWALLAEHYIELERFLPAAEALGRARELEGDMTPPRILVHAELYSMAQQNERALELAEELGDHFYRDIVYARVRLNQRRPAEALEHLEVALLHWPDNAGVQYHAARAAERIGDWSRAIDAYRNSLRAGAAETNAGLRLAQLHEAQRRYQDALVAVEHHVKQHPDDIEAALLAVEFASESSDPKELQGALARIPRDALAEAAAVLAKIRARRRGVEAAIDTLRRSEVLDFQDPMDLPALEALAHLLHEAGRSGEALSMTDAMLEKHPETARLHQIRAGLLEGEESRQALTRALELDPQLEDAALALAALRAREGDAAGALSLLDRLPDPSPEVTVERARLLAELGRRDSAAKLLEDLLWERPYHVQGALGLARLQLSDATGNDAETLDLVHRAVSFGGGEQAYELLALVHEARGELALAAEARAKASELN